VTALASRPQRSIKRRSDRTGERVLYGALAVLAAIVLAPYVVGIVYLLAAGAMRAGAFSQYAVPLQGVSGETGYRLLLSACLGFALGYLLGLAPRALFARGKAPRPRLAKALPRVLGLLGALTFALLLRDHMPRFLLTLPSETKAGGGVGPELFNSVLLAALSTLLSAPIGVGAALYLARFARAKRFVTLARAALDTLASLPSIIYGLFGFLLFVVMMNKGYSLFAGACSLALLNLPIMVAVSEESLRNVPRDLEDASLALGTSKVRTALFVSLPYAWPGILSAIVLSIGRVFAESAPLIMTAGTTVSRATAYSTDPMRGGESLAVHLWYVNSAGLAPDRDAVSAGTATVLLVLVIAVNAIATRLARFGGANGRGA
jgi:phosphate transport system permease protein